MRNDPPVYAAWNGPLQKEPRYVIEVAHDLGATEFTYLTSHADASIPDGATVIHGVIEARGISSTSQRLNPDEGRATIGRMSVRAVDVAGALTEAFHDLASLRGRRVRVYMGYVPQDAGLTTWDDYSLVQTQIVDAVKFSKGVYVLECSDVQRSAREDVFDLAETTLAQSLSADAETIEVYSTEGFELLSHGPSYADAPNQTVGYLRLDDEIIRYTGKTATSFTGCTRGVLNTKPQEHEIDDGTDPERREKVTEFVYLELPGPKLAYAILTGTLYGEGKTIPAGWHLGIPGQYIRTTDFVNIGPDWWDPTDDEKGRVLRFEGLTKTDAKKFLEQEVYLLLGAYSPVHANGELGLRRMSSILADAPYVVELDERHIVSHGDLTHDMGAVKNQIVIRWNWNVTRERYTRTNALIDGDSITQHGSAPVKAMEFRGLNGSRHAFPTLTQTFDAYRDRYSGPPLRFSVTLQMRHNAIEVGDVVRVRLENVRDHVTGESLDRSFEVQSVRVDWIRGQVTLDLFGSAHPASLTSLGSGIGPAISDALYGAVGTNIETLPGVTRSGDLIRITSDLDLRAHGVGAADMTSAAAIVYALGDLQLDAGVTLTVGDNTQLRHRGFFTVLGTIDGAGKGLAGAEPLGEDDIGGEMAAGNNGGFVPGVAGGFGFTKAGGALLQTSSWAGRSAPPTMGLYVSIPPFALSDGLDGLPDDLRGTSGGAGGWVATPLGDGIVHAPGGAGGAGGAGLALIGRGLSIEGSGAINLSGHDGEPGGHRDTGTTFQRTDHGGPGAGGAPGALLVVQDGRNTITTGLETGFVAGLGDAPAVEGASVIDDGVVTRLDMNAGWQPPSPWQPPLGRRSENMPLSARRVIILSPAGAAQPDVPDRAPDPIALTLTEHPETDYGPTSAVTYIEATVTPPSPREGYAYANIYTRRPGGVWALSGPANDEWVITVPADGTTYEVQARAVSITGEVAPSGPVQQITVAGKTSPPADITGFQLQAFGGRAHLGWHLHPDPDVRAGGQIIIRHTSRKSGADWSAAVPIGEPIPGNAASADVPLREGTYLAKARNYRGIASERAARVISSVADIIKLNVVERVREDSDFAGARTNLHVIYGGLALVGSGGPISEEGGPVSEWGAVAHLGGVAAEGLYEFAQRVDLGEEFVNRIAGRLEAFTFRIDDWVDDYGCEDGGVDACGPVDSDTDAASAEIEISVDAGPWTPFYLGDINGQTFDWRVRFRSDDPGVNVLVREIETEVDMPDRVEGDDDIHVDGVLDVEFHPPFRNIPALAVTIDDAQRGDYYTVTDKTAHGARIAIFDTNDQPATRQIDWIAKGYGRALNG